MAHSERRAALITGGTSGIGLAAARTLAEAGHAVFLCARNEESVAVTVKELRAEGLEVSGTGADVRYINPSDNRGAGATMGSALEAYCEDQPFRFRITG